MVSEIADVLSAPSLTSSFAAELSSATAEAYDELSSASQISYDMEIPDDDRAAAIIQYAHLNEAADKAQNAEDPIKTTVTEYVGFMVNGDYVMKTVTKEMVIRMVGGSISYQTAHFIDFEVVEYALEEEPGE